MSTLVECVPNFSEGRDKGKVDAIVDAMKMDGVYLLDREMSPTELRSMGPTCSMIRALTRRPSSIAASSGRSRPMSRQAISSIDMILS